jgi:hypothetical protein
MDDDIAPVAEAAPPEDQPNVSPVVADAVAVTEPGVTHPGWTMDDAPDPETARARMKDLLRTHAIAGRSTDEMAASFNRHFPDVPVDVAKDDYPEWVKSAPQQARLAEAKLQVAKESEAGQGPSGLTPGQGSFFLRRAVSFPRDILTSAMYANAKANINAGSTDPADYRNAALYEHEQGLDASQSAGIKALGLFAGLPSQMAGMELGGAMARPWGAAAGEAMGLGAPGTGALQLAGQAVLSPNLAAQAAILLLNSDRAGNRSASGAVVRRRAGHLR